MGQPNNKSRSNREDQLYGKLIGLAAILEAEEEDVETDETARRGEDDGRNEWPSYESNYR